jgi:hypothetical protein
MHDAAMALARDVHSCLLEVEVAMVLAREALIVVVGILLVATFVPLKTPGGASIALALGAAAALSLARKPHP